MWREHKNISTANLYKPDTNYQNKQIQCFRLKMNREYRQYSQTPPHSKLQQMAHSLFKEILNEERIQIYTSLQPDQIKGICREAGKLFHRKIKRKPNQIIAFLASYHEIIMGYTHKVVNQIINNISLHFLLLASYAMIENGDKASAKDLLKKSLNYIDSTDPDPILLTTALNNLCILRMQRGKYFKSINILLSMIEIMQKHMKGLKDSKNKNQLMEDSVFLVNSYYLLMKCLIKIRAKHDKPFYQQLYLEISQKGLRKALKYLGKQSFLTKRIIEIIEKQQTLQLPVFKKQELQKTTQYQKLYKKIEKIESLLSAPRDPVIIKEIIKQVPVEPVKQRIIHDENKSLVCQVNRMINNWNVQIQIMKEKGQRLGSININCKKGNDFFFQIISEERMFKLWSQMNLLDILPQQCNLNNLSPKQIIQLCIFNFLYINDNKNLQIFPRANNFIVTFMMNLFGKQFVVFFYHIRGNNFRIAFGPKKQSQTRHLQVQLQPQFISKVMQIEEQTSERMFKVYKYLAQTLKRQNTMKNRQSKIINVKDEPKIIKLVEALLKKLQIMVKSFKNQSQINDFFKNNNQFYKFVQFKEIVQKNSEISVDNQNQKQKQKQKERQKNKEKEFEGKIYYIRFLQNIRGFQVNVENTYETHTPQGKSKAKGQMLYNSYQFYRDFGIPSHIGIAKFRCFCQILCEKYEIKSYENPLTTNDKEIYQQNSINQVKVTIKSNLRKMRTHKKSVIPVTACVITVNNQRPVGIKITAYEPVTCFEVGYFIHIDHDLWKWPDKIQEQPQDIINKVVEQYSYKREYFLVDWLEKFGFRKIIQMLEIDEKDNFYIKGLGQGFFRIANLIDLM